MQYQREQLFHDSIGADGIDLGFYSYNTAFFDPTKKGGEPFTMYNTGDFFNKMIVTVRYRKIEITSTTTHLDEMLLNKSFITTNFFGLTEQSLFRLKQQHTTKHIQEWLRTRLTS